ncbi:MAG: polysaccharide deacetylase family protein [Rothia sp.]|uniref:polysaccharide deacetylase family protein n=1 Tax=Rothia sp. (in: high G+C Gram-positive bacteria) TaxID=1885016 RepID=UPI001CAD840C|nr:polysaccharide deacetylase family protein [Rothia sp. (in: high G+C Gram-positive bacteria)]MBF1680142.1 polysaccharide deacetylase family protein [Rothia sp. (in: high G+C Gram-positive bacteria)]
MNTVPHSETPIAPRQSAIADPAATPAVSGASARASMGRRELLRHVGTFGLGAVGFGVLGLGLTGCTPSAADDAHGAASITPSNTPSGSASGSASASSSATPSPSATGSASGSASPTAAASKTASATATSSNPVPAARAWDGPQTGLPGEGKYIAWTVDDGADPEVVRAYAEFAHRTGTRLTFFINGQYPAFKQHRDLLLPLVKSGQLQIANHTYSHAALTSLTDEQIVQELTRNDEEIRRLFGVSSKPYFRPPYGYYDARVLAAAASCGFTRPVLWFGSLADSSNISSAEVYAYAEKYALAQHIVIGHLNYRGVVSELDRIRALLDRRGLKTVTIRDYYG